MSITQLVQDIRLRACDVDCAGRASMQSLFLMMQEAAFDHSEKLGCGPEHMRARGTAWVLSRMRIKMDALPRVHEGIRLVTWPGAPQRVLYPRYFAFERDGVVLGGASSLWVVLDAASRRITSLANDVVFPDTTAFPAPLPLPEKLSLPELTPAETRQARYGDIDLQGHMNNARYAGWVCDLFPAALHAASPVMELQINYLAEVAPQTEVALSLRREGALFSVRGDAGGKSRFEARGEFARA